nr:hypothetical protein [Tanacetum cinerariifolium]
HGGLGAGAGLVIIVYDVIIATLTGVHVVFAPVVNDVVAKIAVLEPRRVGVAAAIKARGAAVAVHKQIVVHTGVLAAPDAAVAVVLEVGIARLE